MLVAAHCPGLLTNWYWITHSLPVHSTSSVLHFTLQQILHRLWLHRSPWENYAHNRTNVQEPYWLLVANNTVVTLAKYIEELYIWHYIEHYSNRRGYRFTAYTITKQNIPPAGTYYVLNPECTLGFTLHTLQVIHLCSAWKGKSLIYNYPIAK